MFPTLFLVFSSFNLHIVSSQSFWEESSFASYGLKYCILYIQYNNHKHTVSVIPSPAEFRTHNSTSLTSIKLTCDFLIDKIQSDKHQVWSKVCCKITGSRDDGDSRRSRLTQEATAHPRMTFRCSDNDAGISGSWVHCRKVRVPRHSYYYVKHTRVRCSFNI